MKYVIALFAGLIPIVPAVILIFKRRQSPEGLARKTVLGLSVLNLVVIMAIAGVALAGLIVPGFVQAAELSQTTGQAAVNSLAYVGAGIAVAGSAIGAGYAVGNVGAAAVGAITEKPDVFGRALIFVGLAEGVAIYGLIIAFIILR